MKIINLKLLIIYLSFFALGMLYAHFSHAQNNLYINYQALKSSESRYFSLNQSTGSDWKKTLEKKACLNKLYHQLQKSLKAKKINSQLRANFKASQNAHIVMQFLEKKKFNQKYWAYYLLIKGKGIKRSQLYQAQKNQLKAAQYVQSTVFLTPFKEIKEEDCLKKDQKLVMGEFLKHRNLSSL